MAWKKNWAGRTLSRPRSRQPNDVMSEIECAQLHSELFRRKHSKRQSHDLLALAKHLSTFRNAFDISVMVEDTHFIFGG